MKFTSLFLVMLLITTSCCGAKEVAKTNTKTSQIKIQDTLYPPAVPDTPISKTVLVGEEKAKEEKKTPLESVNKTTTLQTVFDHTIWDNLLQKHVSSDGKVNYKGFKKDHDLLNKYIRLLSENTPNNTWTKEDKLAYWINAYNALTVDLILRNYPLKSIKDIKDPWDQRLWKLGDKWYNLNEIEHKILRKMNEPRIHFAIVCASYSCPKLQNSAFQASKLDSQLNQAVKEFLADPKRNEITENRVKLSKIFSWFGKDFKQKGSLIDFLNKYTDIKISKNAKISFKDYDWSLNE